MAEPGIDESGADFKGVLQGCTARPEGRGRAARRRRPRSLATGSGAQCKLEKQKARAAPGPGWWPPPPETGPEAGAKLRRRRRGSSGAAEDGLGAWAARRWGTGRRRSRTAGGRSLEKQGRADSGTVLARDGAGVEGIWVTALARGDSRGSAELALATAAPPALGLNPPLAVDSDLYRWSIEASHISCRHKK